MSHFRIVLQCTGKTYIMTSSINRSIISSWLSKGFFFFLEKCSVQYGQSIYSIILICCSQGIFSSIVFSWCAHNSEVSNCLWIKIPKHHLVTHHENTSELKVPFQNMGNFLTGECTRLVIISFWQNFNEGSFLLFFR